MSASRFWGAPFKQDTQTPGIGEKDALAKVRAARAVLTVPVAVRERRTGQIVPFTTGAGNTVP